MDTISAQIDTRLYRTEVTSASGNILISDEPQILGGKNLGLNPTELLAASLASCTVITLRMYINRKEWDVSEINVKIDFERDSDRNVSLFTRKIEVIGEVDQTQRQRLETIANSCPIHKTLTHSIEIKTTLI
ncbi:MULTISPECIES: OsmC family protein [Flavobacterium]|jgi:putative redox protein|uniref:Osmotically inducible protein OsmC n=1 Tax=Flavobacterium pectinovorum TaxID=29533 RepID=A0AB36P7G7_9FLAO|nr:MULTISPECIES: OsmC family protein [Flavobacterium]KIQ22251.1 osmotically inducible protein OsmC [Flavobacterium sp. MEB061]OXB06809.1 osmotically inducible protein OsmC [Flavobacterium pectinovorum]SHL47201.1 putative redox protein [Flavobacterium pectinovorum]